MILIKIQQINAIIILSMDDALYEIQQDMEDFENEDDGNFHQAMIDIEYFQEQDPKQFLKNFKKFIQILEKNLDHERNDKWVYLLEPVTMTYELYPDKMKNKISESDKILNLILLKMASVLNKQNPEDWFFPLKIKDWQKAVRVSDFPEYSIFLKCSYYAGMMLETFNRDKILRHFLPKLLEYYRQKDWRLRSAAISVALQIDCEEMIDQFIDLFLRAGHDENLIIRAQSASAFGYIFSKKIQIKSKYLSKVLPLYEKRLEDEVPNVAAHWMISLMDSTQDLEDRCPLLNKVLERIRYFLERKNPQIVQMTGTQTLGILLRRKKLFNNVQVKQILQYFLNLLTKFREEIQFEKLFICLMDSCSICFETYPIIGWSFIEKFLPLLDHAIAITPVPVSQSSQEGEIPFQFDFVSNYSFKFDLGKVSKPQKDQEKENKFTIGDISNSWVRICRNGKPFENWEEIFEKLKKKVFLEIKYGENQCGVLSITETAKCFKDNFSKFVPEILNFFAERIKQNKKKTKPTEAIECIKTVLIEANLKSAQELQMAKKFMKFIFEEEIKLMNSKDYQTFLYFVKNSNELFKVFHQILKKSHKVRWYEQKKQFIEFFITRMKQIKSDGSKKQNQRSLLIQQVKNCIQQIMNFILLLFKSQQNQQQKQVFIEYLIFKAFQLKGEKIKSLRMVCLTISIKILLNFKFQPIEAYFKEFDTMLQKLSFDENQNVRMFAIKVLAQFISLTPARLRNKEIILAWVEAAKKSKNDEIYNNNQTKKAKYLTIIRLTIDEWLELLPLQKQDQGKEHLIFLAEIIESQPQEIFPQKNTDKKFLLARFQKIMTIFANVMRIYCKKSLTRAQKMKDQNFLTKLGEMRQRISNWELYKENKAEIESSLTSQNLSCLNQLIGLRPN